MPLLLVVLVVATTGHRFANGFVFDDRLVIERGDVIHDPSRIPDVFTHHTFVVSTEDRPDMKIDTYRPLTLLTFFADAALSGRKTWGYHLSNLLLHIFCVLLLYRVTLLLIGCERWPFAAFGTALFALNPWTAGAHVWINGRSDLCGLLFGLCTLWLALKTSRPWLRSLALFATFLSGLLCKEVMLGTAPAIVLAPLLARSASAETMPRRLLRTFVPVAAASLLYLFVRNEVLDGLRTHEDQQTLVLAAQRLPILLLDGLQALLIPQEAYFRSMSDDYAVLPTWAPWAAGALLLALALFAWLLRRRWPVLPWAALWYAGSLAPVAVIAAVLWPGFGRYLYVPGAAVCWVVASGTALLWAQLASRPARLALSASALGLLLVSGFFLVRHTSSYRDDRTLYGRVIAMRPDQGYGWGMLGQYLLLGGDARQAVAPLREAIQRAPEEPRYRLSLIDALLELDQRPEALSIAQKGMREFHADYTVAQFHYALAKILATQDPNAVMFHLVRCLEIAPERSKCQKSLRYLVTTEPNAAAFRMILEQLLEQEEHRGYRALLECRAYDRCG